MPRDVLKLTATPVGNGSIHLEWEDYNLDLYLSYRNQEDETWKLLELDKELSLTFVDLPPGASYEFQLFAHGRRVSEIVSVTVNDG
jgi:hypothetical protein